MKRNKEMQTHTAVLGVESEYLTELTMTYLHSTWRRRTADTRAHGDLIGLPPWCTGHALLGGI